MPLKWFPQIDKNGAFHGKSGIFCDAVKSGAFTLRENP
jgi:hypothetical protein